jgi:hypothetical protein
MVSARNSTIGGTGFLIDQAEILRKVIGQFLWRAADSRSGCGLDQRRLHFLTGVEEAARRQHNAFLTREAGHDADTLVADIAKHDVAPFNLVALSDDEDMAALGIVQAKPPGRSTRL